MVSLDYLFYPMNDSVESNIEDTFKKGLISPEESSTIHVFCKQKLSDRAILPIITRRIQSMQIDDRQNQSINR